MSLAMLEFLGCSFLETLVMTGAAGAISLALGLPLALLLVAIDKGTICSVASRYRSAGLATSRRRVKKPSLGDRF